MPNSRVRFPRCRHGCYDGVIFVNVPFGCICFPNDRKQWLCLQHFLKLIDHVHDYEVIADVVSLGWGEGELPI